MALIRVTFKHEDAVGVEPVGPVVIWDMVAYENDPLVTERRQAGTAVGLPYGYVPTGMVQIGWRTRTQAQAIAAALELTLEQT